MGLNIENESTKLKRSSSTCRLIASAGILELYQSIFCRIRVKFLISTVQKPKLFNPQIFVIRKKYCHFLLGFLLPPVLCKVFSPPFLHPLQHLSNSSNVTSTVSPIFLMDIGVSLILISLKLVSNLPLPNFFFILLKI